MGTKTKLLFIAGDGRSGTTLVARLLGELDHYFNAGEMLQHFFDEKMHTRDMPCGCNRRAAECEFWCDISMSVDPQARAFSTRYVRTRHLPLLASRRKSQELRRGLERLSASITSLVGLVAEKSRSKVVIDSSKNPPYAFLIGQLSDPEPYILHIVKDPRDVVASWKKPKAYIQRRSLGSAVMGWSSFNIMNEWAARATRAHYRLLRYEDFVAEPEQSLQDIVRWIEGSDRPLPFLSGRKARLGMQHLLGGNPDKFQTGEVEIKARATSLEALDRLLTSALTLPLLARYHYPLMRSGKRA